MAFSVESRAPFLDYRLVEFCINLPTEYKLTGGINKIILRESIGEMLPKKVIQRKGKQGFESPESSWLLSHDNHNLLKEVLKESEENNSDIISSDAFRYSEKILSKEEKYDEFLWKLISFSEWRKSLDI